MNKIRTIETFHFRRGLGTNPDHAFEVRRSEFDQLLFEACREAGADAREATRVTSVEKLGDGTHRVTTVDDDGREQTWDARFVVDASGRDTFLSGSRGWKRRNPKHASAAVYAHFRGVTRREGALEVSLPELSISTRLEIRDRERTEGTAPDGTPVGYEALLLGGDFAGVAFTIRPTLHAQQGETAR